MTVFLLSIFLQVESVTKAFEYDIFLGLLTILISGIIIFLVKDRNYYRSKINDLLTKSETEQKILQDSRFAELTLHSKELFDLHKQALTTQADTNRILENLENLISTVVAKK